MMRHDAPMVIAVGSGLSSVTPDALPNPVNAAPTFMNEMPTVTFGSRAW